MKILLIGGGAREHIIAEKLTQSDKCTGLLVYASSLNPGIRRLSERYEVGQVTDVADIRLFAETHKPDFAVVGPENPIAAGVVDELKKIGVPSVAPTQKLAQLESSKSFTRELLTKYKIPGNPGFRAFTSENGMTDYAASLGQIVVKADGLRGGKGVQVQGDHFQTIEEGLAYARDCLAEDGRVVIEEKLVGQEFSLMSFVDGEHLVHMPPIQDHKRAYEDDTGPNTGGMGSYNGAEGLPFLTENDVRAAHDINVRTVQAVKQELGEPFKGILYGGFIAVRDGVRLIEYNVRFGDPEAMNALTLLQTDFADVCQAILNGTLDKLDIRFAKRASVCKYAVPEGYPDSPKKGVEIRMKPLPHGVKAYFAAVDERDGKLFMTGSRAIAFVGVGDTIETAEKLAQAGVECVQGPVFYRRDIGTRELIQKRVEMMKQLRGGSS